MGLLKKIFKGKKKGEAPAASHTEALQASTEAQQQPREPISAGKPPPSPHVNNYADHLLQNDATRKQAAEDHSNHTTDKSATDAHHHRYASYASGASTPEWHSDEEQSDSSSGNKIQRCANKALVNPKTLTHSTSQIGLDEMIEDRRCEGDLRQNVVHIEVPFGKPIEEVYEGVHSGPVLGSGISGLVRLVSHKATGLKYAVKVLDLGLVDTTEGLQQLREEIFIMCQLDHPNIVRLEEVYESQSEIYLVQELCLGGELFDRLDEQPDYHYTEGECARLVKQMLSAVRYLHSRGIIHRDLKLENFLFSSTAKDSELKMIDFGLSKFFRYGEVQHEAVGTPYTVAPEVIRGTYDERCDIWAIGVITFLLLSGDPPFGGCGGPEPLMTVRANILKGSFVFEPEDIWAHVSSLARQFIRDMLKTDPNERPTARHAQKHQWLQEWASRSRTRKDNVLNPNVVKALVNFKEFSDMRKLLCEVLSFTLVPSQIKDLRNEFEKMDTDGSGEISLAALKQVLVTNAGAGSLGALKEEEVEDIFNAMRVRKTETRIHWHEFIAAGLSQCQVDDRNLRLAFDRLDSDHKGYIILDDIMDLMGSDALQSEDDMHRMWGDSVKAVKGQHARITYDDFLLLMKGQTKESPGEFGMESVSNLIGTTLDVVQEAGTSFEESPEKAEPSVTLPSGDFVTSDGTIKPASEAQGGLDGSGHTPLRSSPLMIRQSSSAPATPADHRKILDLDMGIMESPLSMDEDGDITSSGPGVPGCAASLTPPMSPSRGAEDYITPAGVLRGTVDFKDFKAADGLELPGLPDRDVNKPVSLYTRRRSQSLDGHEKEETERTDQQLSAVADAVLDLMLPESDHQNSESRLSELVKDESQSALQVNRKLYRAHRQMRLAVLDASKRFEEQQTEHARGVLLAARETEDNEDDSPGMIQAGLVMRHGHKKQVSSKAIRNLLETNRAQQQVLVEKANRRGGRGRRSRKKTISDMSGMMTSMGQDDLSSIAQQASSMAFTDAEKAQATSKLLYEDMALVQAGPESPKQASMSALPEITEVDQAQLRGATVPGEFRKTSDPFGRQGRYGAAAGWRK